MCCEEPSFVGSFFYGKGTKMSYAGWPRFFVQGAFVVDFVFAKCMSIITSVV